MSDVVDDLPLAGPGFSVTVPDTMVTDIISHYDTDNEDTLALRYGRPGKAPEELIFEFTRDPALLYQYNLIYEKEFKAVHNAHNYRQVVDEHDRHAHFLIIRIGNLCVGGARMSTKSPRQPQALPIEFNDFKIENHFPQLKKKEMTYGQVGRICLLPDFRGGDITRRMFWHIHRKAVALGWSNIYATAAAFNARMIRKHCLAIGLKETKIHTEIELPPYPMCEEIKMYFLSIGINKAIIASANEPVTDLKTRFKEMASA